MSLSKEPPGAEPRKKKRYALLLCGHVPEPFAEDPRHRFPAMFPTLLATPSDPHEHWTHFECEDGRDIPTDATLQSFDAVVLSGSEQSAMSEAPWMLEVEALLRAAAARRQRVLAVCFGAQLLAKALGGTVEKAVVGLEVGATKVDVDLDALRRHEPRRSTWAADFAAPSFHIAQYHEDEITELPPGADRLGSSARCRNEMYAVEDFALALQGHPEMSDAFMRHVLEVYRGRDDKPPGAVLDGAAVSLETHPLPSTSSPANEIRALCRAFLKE